MDFFLTRPQLLEKSLLKPCDQTRAFSGEGLCKTLAFMEIWFLLTWVSVHENVHQLRQQVIDIKVQAWKGSLWPCCCLAAYCRDSQQGHLWKMHCTWHISLCLWGNGSISQCLHHLWLTLWSLRCLVFYVSSALREKQRKPRKLLPVFPGNVTTSPAPWSAQPRRPCRGQRRLWWGRR